MVCKRRWNVDVTTKLQTSLLNRINGVMVSVLSLSVVDRGFEAVWVKPKTRKLVFVASPLDMQQ